MNLSKNSFHTAVIIITRSLLFVLVVILHASCGNPQKENSTSETISDEDKIRFVTPLGKEISASEPSKKLVDQHDTAKAKYEKNPDDVDKIIWYGRRVAYLGKYEDAIAIYSKGIDKFPKNPRLYRHRGHRYISLRKFDKAIEDLEKAGKLIEGTENEIEPDGMPNAMNIPVSTLHGNIWYHLGLAYYLKHDYENSSKAYTKCRASGKLPDNIVSSTHWLYMIQRRLGNLELANTLLEPISEEMNVIENQSYHDLCKLYKGIIPIDSLLQTRTGSPANDAVSYGIANWYFYNGERKKAEEIMKGLIQNPSWSSFGYISAESDLIEYFD